VELITNALLDGELKPGDRLPTENEFASRLGVGRNSVREAIKMLSSVGAVEIRRGAGTFVAEKMSPAMINPLILSLAVEQGTSREWIELRLVLDTAAAQLALQRDPQPEISRLEQANRKLFEEIQRSEHQAHRLRNLDLGFHEVLLELSGNRMLAKIGKAVYRLFFASIEKTVEADPMLAYRNHEMVLDAMRRGDVQLIRDRMKASLSFWIETISEEARAAESGTNPPTSSLI
jgi:DNA-binding FadR family transcriptional regulator